MHYFKLSLACLLAAVFAWSTASVRAEEKSILLLGVDAGEAEIGAWFAEILGPEGIRGEASDTWVAPKEWGPYAAVVVAGKSPARLDEAASADLEQWLREGGVFIAVGAALPSMIHAEGVSSATLLPDWARAWVGAERWAYVNQGVEEYSPQASVWPWPKGVPFHELIYGRYPYGLMGASGAECIVGREGLAMIAVHRVGKGAFIFVGPLLHRLQSLEKEEVSKGEPEQPRARTYVETMVGALKAILNTPPDARE